MKKFLSLVTAIVMTVSLCIMPVYAQTYEEAAADAQNAEINYNRSVPLEVKGNKIVKQGTDEMVVLRGVNVPSMDWGMAEHLFESMTMVYDSWGANLIRLPINPKYWKNGSIWDEKNLTKEQYQKYIDDMVKAAQARGKYIILDCHRYVMPQQDDLDMWKELAVKYGNNSAVLFGLLNEPHDIKPVGVEKPTTVEQWDVWYNGGQIIVGGEEVTAIGHQQLLNEIRKQGANNICIAGGLNWAFDISGFADGYNERPNGYRLIDTAEGHGVMYDSHAYPVKGAKTAWDTIIGPVRRVAPVIIGEWGWDSSDKNISGGDCTSDIWMNQIMNWMDDTDNQYDGIPVNWTAWNLHMSSSPKMLYSWDYKTTAYNGTHIKNRLLSYNTAPEKLDGVYSTDFSTDDVFRSYTAPSGKASIKYSDESGNVAITPAAANWYATLNFPFDWDLNGIQTITMDISAATAGSVNIGLYGSDMEVWTKAVDVNTEVQTVTIGINELVKQGNPQTDGKLDAALSGIYFGAATADTGSITIDNVKIVKLATPVYTANTYPHKDMGEESYIDIDTTGFKKQTTAWNSKFTGTTMQITDANVLNINGETTKTKCVTYTRDATDTEGCRAKFDLNTVPSMNAKYFTIDIKGNGIAQKLTVSLSGLAYITVNMAEDDTDWHQYIYSLEGNVEYPEDITYVQISADTRTTAEFYIDNIGFSNTKPKRLIPYPEKTFVYDFATYNKNTTKYEAAISTESGSEGDTIVATKEEGGLGFDSKALEVKYSRNGNIPSKAKVVYSPNDFFKGNVNDDERTANRATLKTDMEYMTDFVFYGKSTSGKNEKINVGVIDAASAMTTYTDTKEFTLTTEWKQFRVPFDEFKILDGGSNLDCARVRGFIFSSAENSGEGSFMIDNITHTSIKGDIEWGLPTPTPEPTPTPLPDPVTVTTAEQLAAITSTEGNIILGADIDLGTTGFTTKSVTHLDLNGHTLTSSGPFVVDPRHEITIVDTGSTKGAIINTGTTQTSYGIRGTTEAATINIDGAEIDAGGQAILINVAGRKCNIKDAVINGGSYAINVGTNGGEINIDNALINNKADYKGYALYLQGGIAIIDDGTFGYNGTTNTLLVARSSELTINGGTFTNPNSGRGAIVTDKQFVGTVTINGGVFENTNAGGYSILDSNEGYQSIDAETSEIIASPVININDGTFKSAIGKTKPTNSSATEISIKGGQFAADPTVLYPNCIDTDIYSITKVAEGKYVVTEKGVEPTPEPTPEPVAKIVSSIEEINTLTASDDYVKLGADIDLGTSSIKTKCAMRLDLNGHTLSGGGSTVIEAMYNLTVVDTGTTKGTIKNVNTSTSYGIKFAVKDAVLTIDGAKVEAMSQAIMLSGTGSILHLKDSVINGNSYAVNLSNGIINIENTVINDDSEYKGYALSVANGTAVINSGIFNYNGNMSSITFSGSSEITINGGTFKNSVSKRGAINTVKGFSGTLTINGGTFENTAENNGYSILDGDEATTETVPVINITGGTFKSTIGATKPANTTTVITISGGTYSFDPTNYVTDTETYRVIDNGDGTYKVAPNSQVYSVTLNACGGSEVMVEDFKEENIPDNGIELPIPTKAGYKFDGWYTEENNGSQVNGITKDNLSDIFRNEATVTLYAHWTLLNYTITYEGLNDATNTNPSNYTVETEAITLAAPGTRKGYTFGGWYTDVEYQNKIEIIEQGTTGNKILYAKWDEIASGSITASFVSTGTIPSDIVQGTINVAEKAYENDEVSFTVTLPKGYTLENVLCTADGENLNTITEENGSYTFIMPGKNVTITVNVRPIQYTINLDLQEGTGTTTTIYGSVENLPVLPNDNPEKQGYNFKGWFDAPTKGTVITMDNLNTASNMLALFGNNTELTIYAQYTEVGNFVVIYSAVGADEETIPTDNTQYNIAETSIIKIPNQEPKKLGYTFEGWKTGTDDTVYKYGTQNDTYTVPNDISGAITFIAQWSINEYKITYELNGGINAENAPVSYTIETDTITLPVPTKDGYNFEGWYTDAAFENAVAAIAKGSVGDMVLYAKWSEKDMAVYKINSYEKGNVSVRKRTDTDDSSSVVIVAFYKTLNNNSVLIKTSIAEIGAIEKGDDISKTVEEPEDYSYAKVFMWNDLNGMMPRCNSLKMDK